MAEHTAPSASSASPSKCYDGDGHAWEWTKGPRMPFWIGRCTVCHNYNWVTMHQDLTDLGVKLVGK